MSAGPLTLPLQGGIFALLILVGFLLVGAVRTQSELDRAKHQAAITPRPYLKFWEGEAQEGPWIVRSLDLPGSGLYPPILAASAIHASSESEPKRILLFGRVFVANDPPADLSGEEARAVSARIQFIGQTHHLSIDGRWAKTPQAPVSGFYNTDINIAIDIPSNSRAHKLDVLVQDLDDGEWYAFNDLNASEPTARYAPHHLRDNLYKVLVTVRGANTPPLTEMYRLDRNDDGRLRLLREERCGNCGGLVKLR